MQKKKLHSIALHCIFIAFAAYIECYICAINIFGIIARAINILKKLKIILRLMQ